MFSKPKFTINSIYYKFKHPPFCLLQPTVFVEQLSIFLILLSKLNLCEGFKLRVNSDIP